MGSLRMGTAIANSHRPVHHTRTRLHQPLKCTAALWEDRSLIIGLTGGIASGKSTVAAKFGELGAYVIDADKLGHKAYLKGSEAFFQIVDTFGEDVVGPDGEIDRVALGAKVFGEGNRLKELTDIVWPAIRHLADAEIASVRENESGRTIVLEAAVLLEAGWQDLVDEIWVTVVDREVAISRATARDGIERAAVEARIDAQLSNEERTSQADRVIDNSQDTGHLIDQLTDAWSLTGSSS